MMTFNESTAVLVTTSQLRNLQKPHVTIRTPKLNIFLGNEVRKSKKDKKEKKIKEEKSPKEKRELTKRPLSSASEAEDFEDIKPQKKARPEPKKAKRNVWKNNRY